jgi:hypothetical protein
MVNKDKVNETHGVWILTAFVVLFVICAAAYLPGTLDGLNYGGAVLDALGLRLVKLAVFDVHFIGLLYFWGGKSFKIVRTFKLKPISTALLIAAALVGSALVLM